MTENTTTEKKPMHFAAYLGLYIGAWIAGAVVANGVSIIMGSIYAQATAPVIIGFWIGKSLMKNRRRDWIGVLCFPIFTFVSGLFGHAMSYALANQSASGVNYSALISLVMAFVLSCGLFSILNTKRKVLD